MRAWTPAEARAYGAQREPSPADDCAVEWLKGKTRVLELGSGPALVAARLSRSWVVCTDVSPGFLTLARVNAPASTALAADPRHLPFSDGVFDAVLAMAVLHHIHDRSLALALDESRRVLSPDGEFVLVEDWAFTDPSPFEDKARRLRFEKGPGEFHRTREAWDGAFREAGFRRVRHLWPLRPFRMETLRGEVRMLASLYVRLP